jgi:hypothetical protein
MIAQPDNVSDGTSINQSSFFRPTTRIGKIGCGFLLVVWFAVLLLPITMFWFAMGQTIMIPRWSGVAANDYPLLEIQLVMEIRNRGFQIKTTGSYQPDEMTMCYQTQVRYLLWESDSSDDQSTQYCECFSFDEASNDWDVSSLSVVTCAQ